MSPLINWEEIRKLAMPPGPQSKDKGNIWDKSADMYNRMAKMENIYTLNQINAFETTSDDTVLDIGCGPGRISVPMARRAKSVTSLDSSEKMLAHCRQNAEEAGVKNLKPLLLDWEKAVPGENLEKHDIVIASRSPGMTDIKKMSSFARKFAVVIAWANAPNIPTVIGDLFKGVEETRRMPPMRMDRSLGYNITYNIIYDAGYDPNVRIVTDGFTRDFLNREEAYRELWKLREVTGDIPPVFRQNVDKWLTVNQNGGVTFRRETRSFVMWWEPAPADS
ncbi:MAG: class I SAM-dependent methyltransferase [Dehalococcoidales bacterium]|nr:class I SAM-dependent methyltransferase [Dehalococcoidales bacterium]